MLGAATPGGATTAGHARAPRSIKLEDVVCRPGPNQACCRPLRDLGAPAKIWKLQYHGPCPCTKQQRTQERNVQGTCCKVIRAQAHGPRGAAPDYVGGRLQAQRLQHNGLQAGHLLHPLPRRLGPAQHLPRTPTPPCSTASTGVTAPDRAVQRKASREPPVPRAGAQGDHPGFGHAALLQSSLPLARSATPDQVRREEGC